MSSYRCMAETDRRLKIPHSAKAECGFRTTPLGMPIK